MNKKKTPDRNCLGPNLKHLTHLLVGF